MSSLINSKHQKLSTDEIIGIAAKEAGQGETFEQVKASLVAEVHKAKAILMREGNTLFVVHRSPQMPSVAVFRTLNADTVPNYCKNCVVFGKALGLAGFKSLFTAFPGEDKELLSVVKYVVNKHPPFKNMSYQVGKKPDGTFVVMINLGTPKTGGLPDRSKPQTEGAI